MTQSTAPVVLSALEQRIVGALLEKQTTVPATYPLTLSALRTACNQSSSRDPVSDHDEPTLLAALKELRHRDLVRVVHGERALKYHQTLTEHLDLDPAERAVLTVLLLRGPQAPGELRTRTERLHPFADRAAVETTLAGLAARPDPLVEELPRQPGQHDPRWIHLLGPVESATAYAATAPGTEPDLDAEVLAGGAEARDARVRAAYASVAEDYAAAYGPRFPGAEIDRWLLRRVAELAQPDPVIEVGCGPAAVAALLAEAGARVSAQDFSPEMVAQARALHPWLSIEVGDLRALMRPRDAHAWGAVVAWFALVHLAPREWAGALAGFARVLRPGGVVTVAQLVGGEVQRVERWFEREVDVTFVRPTPEAVLGAFEQAGLTVTEWYVRGRQEGEQSERMYVLARTPGRAAD